MLRRLIVTGLLASLLLGGISITSPPVKAHNVSGHCHFNSSLHDHVYVWGLFPKVQWRHTSKSQPAGSETIVHRHYYKFDVPFTTNDWFYDHSSYTYCPNLF